MVKHCHTYLSYIDLTQKDEWASDSTSLGAPAVVLFVQISFLADKILQDLLFAQAADRHMTTNSDETKLLPPVS